MKYEQWYEGEWAFPKMKGWKLMCCDCGLVHVIDFKKHKETSELMMKIKRDNRATAAARKGKQLKKIIKK